MSPAVRRLLFWAVPLLLLAAGLAWAFVPRPVAVDLTAVTRGPLAVHVEGEGETRVRDVYVVSAPVGGRMQRLAVKVGDAVTGAGDVLAVIRPADPAFLDARGEAAAGARVRAAEAAVAVAQADLARARAQADYADGELTRISRLAKDGTAAPRDLDRAQADQRAAAASLKAAEDGLAARQAEQQAAEAELMQPLAAGTSGAAALAGASEGCCVRVTAPVAGRVLAVKQESEAVVSAGQPLLEIGDPARLEVVADLLSSDAVKVQPGMAVDLVDWGGPDALAGVVRRVEPTGFTKVSALGIEEQRVNLRIDPAPTGNSGTDWPASLGHGFRVVAQVRVWSADDVPIVPMGAVFREGQGWAVFRVTDGVAHRQPVTLGHMNGTAAEVLDGVAAGDLLVLHPGDAVREGVAVEARAEE